MVLSPFKDETLRLKEVKYLCQDRTEVAFEPVKGCLTRKLMFLPLCGQSVCVISGPDNQRGPTPWGVLYHSVPCLACRSRDGLFCPVSLLFQNVALSDINHLCCGVICDTVDLV